MLSVLSKCGEEAQGSVVRQSLVVAPAAAAAAVMKEHVRISCSTRTM